VAVGLDDVGLCGEPVEALQVGAVRPRHEVLQDPQGEDALEVVVGGVGEDRDPEAQLGKPPEVGQEPVAAAAVVEQVEVPAGPPPGAGDAEGVAGRCPGVRRGDGPHLLHEGRVEHRATVDGPAAQLEPEEVGEVSGARPQSAGGGHRAVHGR
jgi:hypothetical protein